MHLSAWSRWQQAAGPWRGWVMCPALSMPWDGLPSPCDMPLIPEPLGDVEAALVGGGTALALDLEPSWGVRIAAAISRTRLAHVVLVLPRWPHADAVLPASDLVATLVGVSRHLRTADAAASVVFVLDGQRQQRIHRSATDSRIDNRYALLPNDLPDLARLRAAGVQRIVKVVRAP